MSVNVKCLYCVIRLYSSTSMAAATVPFDSHYYGKPSFSLSPPPPPWPESLLPPSYQCQSTERNIKH